MGLFIQYVGIFILLSSHSTALSMYPINDASLGGGPMIKVANVDLDEEEEAALNTPKDEDDHFDLENAEDDNKNIDIEV
jgi:hypothetical protein